MRPLPPARLEEWMREYYFQAEIDIGSSGVEDLSFAELREMLGITADDLDGVVFRDSETLGGAELRAAIARRWTAGAEQSVMATHGSSEAIFLAMTALLAPGDEVLALAPCYQQLIGVAESIGCAVRHWPMKADRGFEADLDALRRSLSPKTRMLVVNFPHNPTGRSLTREDARALVGAAAARGTYLVWDGAFGDITYDAPPLPSPLDAYDRALVLGTLSKCYGLPGLRVGWCLASPDVLARMACVRDYVTLHLSPLVELIATRVIDGADRILARWLPLARRNRQVVTAWMQEHRDYASWAPPDGGVCAFPRLEGITDTEPFCRALAESHRVLLVPGTCFGHPGHVRLGFGRRTELLSEGLSRLSDGLRGYRCLHPSAISTQP
jgi:capreomycidine synthase